MPEVSLASDVRIIAGDAFDAPVKWLIDRDTPCGIVNMRRDRAKRVLLSCALRVDRR